MLLRHMIVSDGYISYGGCAGLFNDGNIILSSDTFSNNHSHGDGGGICNSGIMTVTTSVITNNSADSHAGGIYNVSTLHIIDSVISDNHAYSNSGILNWCDVPTCTLSITNSIISDNSSDWGPAGIYNIGTLSIHESTLSGNNGQIGAIANGGIANLTDSTLSGNIAWFGGGGIYNWSTMTVSNSTLSGNSADLINGNGGAIDSYMGNLTVANSTLSGNSAKYGGSIYNNDEYSSIVVVNTIIGTSTSGNECQGTIIDGGHNISSDSSCNLSPVNGSMLNTDPLLGPLQNNNGPTWTQALLEGSPAIDAGDDAQCLPADQRGVPRPQDRDNDDLAICDIGSYEVAGPNIPLNLVYIQGASQGTMNQVYSFTSIIEPFYTTLPLTYTWRADAQLPIFHSEMGLTDIVSYSWEMPGTYAITVTASNLAGSVMDTHMITILHDLYLPLVIKSSEEPIGYNPLLLPTR